MTQTVIASQLPTAVSEQLAKALPQARVLAIPSGAIDRLPDEVNVLFAVPMRIKGQIVSDTPPSGWPFNLRWVQLMSSGIDAYPRWLFDLPVATARGSSANAIAEFALATIFAAAKRLPEVWLHDATRWDWNRRPKLAPLHGSTLGIVGFGAIGQALARKAVALGLRVRVVRRSNAALEVDGVERAADLHALFAASDHVVLAAPLSAETHHLIDAAVLAASKPGLHLINIARGGLIDSAALLAALDAGRVGLASLDVTEPEPLPAGHAFYAHPKVHLTPHISGSSPDLFDKVLAIFLHNLDAFERGSPLLNRVDTFAPATTTSRPTPATEKATEGRSHDLA